MVTVVTKRYAEIHLEWYINTALDFFIICVTVSQINLFFLDD